MSYPVEGCTVTRTSCVCGVSPCSRPLDDADHWTPDEGPSPWLEGYKAAARACLGRCTCGGVAAIAEGVGVR